MKHSMTLIAVAALLTLASCQKKAPEQQTTATTPPAMATTPTATATQPTLSSPAAATEEIGHYAENLYDWARTGDWAKVEADLTALKTALANLKSSGQATDPHGADELLATLEKAIQAHDARALMHAANDMTRAAADISRQFDPKVPVEVTLLDYYGRELELWAEEGNAANLNDTRSKLRETWDKVRPAVVAKSGNTEAAQFDALVAQLAIAATPKDFTAVATPILDSVDALENVFNRG
jgi:hypothetical protein